MRVCLDTNVLLQLFGRKLRWPELRVALATGRVELAVSNEILLEYEEVIAREAGAEQWRRTAHFLQAVADVHRAVHYLDPRFQFRLIIADPDDNKFADCAIAAQADFIVTEDVHFDALR